MAVQIQLRRGTAAAWAAANPLLADGEVGYETDTDKLKVGDGVALWNALPYFTGGAVVGVVSAGMPLPRDGKPGKDSFIPGPPGVGVAGAPGAPGAAGATGSAGPPGLDGKRGPEGFAIPGQKGDKGDAGAPGGAGPAGAPGLPGMPGRDAKPAREPILVPGAKGDKGDPGAGGAAGAPGATGLLILDPKLPREPLMIPGPMGLQGPQGNAGAPGGGGGGAPSMLMPLDGKPGRDPILFGPQQIEGVKISALPAAADLTGAEAFAAVQGGATVKATSRQIAKYIGDAIQNQSFTSQSPAANATTYLAGTALAIPTGERVKVGSWCRWKTTVKKTAAGTAAKSFAIKVGTAGTTADTTRVTLALPVGTGVVDEGDIEIFAGFTTIGAAAILEAVIKVNHRLVTTGLINVQESIVRAVSAGFDSNVDLLIIGLAFVAGLAEAWTFDVMMSEARNL